LIEIKIPPFNANGKKLTTRASYLASETHVNKGRMPGTTRSPAKGVANEIEFGEMAERLKALPC
jgi:hypothetical protein